MNDLRKLKANSHPKISFIYASAISLFILSINLAVHILNIWKLYLRIANLNHIFLNTHGYINCELCKEIFYKIKKYQEVTSMNYCFTINQKLNVL